MWRGYASNNAATGIISLTQAIGMSLDVLLLFGTTLRERSDNPITKDVALEF